jgi:O-antigen ligase
MFAVADDVTRTPPPGADLQAPAEESAGVAVAILAALMVASFSVFDGGTHRSFFVPKLLTTYATGVAALAVMLLRGERRWPTLRASVWTGAALVAIAFLALNAAAPEQAWVELSVLACGAILFLCVAQHSPRERRLLSWAVVGAAALQLAVALLQAFDLRALLPAALHPRPDRAAFGSVGNPEYLATLLGVAAALGLDLLPRPPSSLRRRLAALIGVALLLGLAATRNKGGVALLGGWGAWRVLARWPRARPWALAGLALLAVGLVSLLAPESVKGRALLWIASVRIIADHPWLGVGAGQLQNVYLAAVRELFVGQPRLAGYLGAHTAQVDDAHNLLLQSWATLGLPGLAMAAALLAISVRLCRRTGRLGLALAWLAGKSLYTVVLGSLSGTLLWALALGLAPGSWRRAALTPGRRWLLGICLAALTPAYFGVRLAFADRAYHRGAMAQAEGNASLAQASFEEATRWQPGFAEAHLGKAYVHFGRGEREQMEDDLEKALRFGQTMDVIKISAHMRFYSHLYAEARPLYTFLHETFPEHLTSMAKLALIRLEAGDEDGARAMARSLLATRPRHRNLSDDDNREIARRILEAP